MPVRAKNPFSLGENSKGINRILLVSSVAYTEILRVKSTPDIPDGVAGAFGGISVFCNRQHFEF
jgi:hypothetical protein